MGHKSLEGVAYKRNVSHAKKYFGSNSELPSDNNGLNSKHEEIRNDMSRKNDHHGGDEAMNGVEPVIEPDLPRGSLNRQASEQTNQAVGMPETHAPMNQRPKRITRAPEFLKDYVPK